MDNVMEEGGKWAAGKANLKVFVISAVPQSADSLLLSVGRSCCPCFCCQRLLHAWLRTHDPCLCIAVCLFICSRTQGNSRYFPAAYG